MARKSLSKPPGLTRPPHPASALTLQEAIRQRRQQLGAFSTSHSYEHWIGIKDALDMIVRQRDVGAKNAKVLLVKACSSTKVRSRYLAIWEGPSAEYDHPYLDRRLADLDEKTRNSHIRVKVAEKFIDLRRIQLIHRAIHPSKWRDDQAGSIDLATGAFHAEDTEGSVEIHADELTCWLACPSKGPAPGTVSRYSKADQALFSDITRLMREEKISATEAAWRLVLDGKVARRGTEDSRVRRVVRAYKKRH